MFDKLKKLFVIEEGTPNTPSQNQSTTEASVPTKETPEVTPEPNKEVVTAYETPSGKADPKFIDILLKAIEKNNLDGFDYLEYKSSLQGLDNMNMDEETRYKSAFVMAKTMGVSPSKLMNSAKHYVKVLNQEEKKFLEALKKQRQLQVSGKEEELIRLQKEVEAKNAKIEQLKKEIINTEKKYDKIKSTINKNAAKVESTNDAFMHAYKVVLGQIMTDVENMKKYLS